jgi:hypothetical protein
MLAGMNINLPVGTADVGSKQPAWCCGHWVRISFFNVWERRDAFFLHVQRARMVCGDNHPGRHNVDVYLLQGDQRRCGECAREQAADVHRRDGLAMLLHANDPSSRV